MLPVDDPPNAIPDIYRDRYERCFRDHYAQLLAFSMRRVSGREIAEDVVADSFAIAWRRRDRIPDPALPWLYAIAAHVIANQYRSTRRRHNLDMRLAHETGAVATARHWPVLLQMVREKGYRGNALPPHGQGWPSEILTAAREIARGHLRRKPAVRTIYVKGRPAGHLTPAGAAPASVMGCL